MKINYEEFLSRYEGSGMTQQEFGKQEGYPRAWSVTMYVEAVRQENQVGFLRST